MHPQKVSRNSVKQLTDLPNIGKAIARDLHTDRNFQNPDQLIGRSPLEMYHDLCKITGTRHDPCVIDVFMSVTSFMSGGEPRTWWHFTEERKRLLAGKPLHRPA